MLFHDIQHPRALSTVHVAEFLNHLAVDRRVSASTQSQALNAIAVLYDSVLEAPLGEIANLQRVQRRQRVPAMLMIEEVGRALAKMTGTPRLMAELIYGSGLRWSIQAAEHCG